MFPCHTHTQSIVPLFQLLNTLHPPLRIRNHLAKQIRKARLTDLGRLGPIQRPMIDGLPIARILQPRLLASRRARL